MKQFFTYVGATIVGLWITIILATIGSFLMLILMLAVGSVEPTPTIKKHSVLHITLDGEVVERTEGQSLRDVIYGISEAKVSLSDVVNSLRHAATDPKIDGVFIDCRNATGGAASMAAIREAVEEFRLSGKWVTAYADSYNQPAYFVASAADSLWLNPVGAVDIHGIGGQLTFFKGLLDKLGVQVQVIKVGTYKSAVEPFILTAPSEANVHQIRSYITPIWNYMTDAMAESRNVTAEEINAWADSIIVTQDPALFPERRVVDRLVYRHEAEEAMKALTDRDADDDLRLVTPSTYMASVKDPKRKKHIAVLYAVGDIVDYGNEGISAEKMVPLILDLADDDDIDGLVLRVNSGGGSAFASEQIWEALEQFKATGKPFYVSMGDVAASGGYYISCGADRIFAQPVTITGSIGIFGMIPSIKGLLSDKLGVTTATIATNPNATMGIIDPLTPVQLAAMQRMIDRGYETFTTRCAEGRHMELDSIKAVAEGRVWDGSTALSIGLVDNLGTLDECIEALALNNDITDYSTVIYPRPKGEWWEEIIEQGNLVKSALVKNELGEAAQLFEAVKRLERIEHIQARAPEITIR